MSEQDKTFPVQARRPDDPTSVPWALAKKVYASYSEKYGGSQSLETISRRGGFGTGEMDVLYPEWREQLREAYP